MDLYGADVAHVHDSGHGDFARDAAPGVLDGMVKGSSDPLISELLGLPAEAAWERLRGILDENGVPFYHVPSTELLDDYEIYCVADDRVARFLWMKRPCEPGVLRDVRVPRSEVVGSLRDLHAVYKNLLRSP